MPTQTNLVFLPWVRRGMAAAIVRPDGPPGATALPVTQFEVALTVQPDVAGKVTALSATVDLPLVGPGDIVGLDSRVVVRTTPGKDESDAEFKHFVSIEFDQADLPWRYTPAAAPTNGQLHSWLTLVVVENNDTPPEWKLEDPTPGQKLPVADVALAALPPLDTGWASAHVQLSGSAETATTPTALAPFLQGPPGQVVARLICPRVLRQQTSYTALLVPTYLRGAMAGLGQDPGMTDALQFAWDPTDTANDPVRLPVYYQWSFQTGVVGDFTDLATSLVPQPIAATVGRRNMDVSVPGFDLPNAAVTPTGAMTPATSIPLEGALQSFQASQLQPPAPSAPWVTAIEAFVNTNMTSVGGTVQQLVAPPMYGRWHAAQTALGPTATPPNPPWFLQLNNDPQNRVPAGLGTLVVEERHQDLMASAWSQIEGLLQSNSEKKILQLGRESFNRMFTRHLQSGTPDSLLLILGILQRWVLTGPGGTTIHAAFANSPVGRGIFDPQWRRWSRPRGPVGRRQGRHIPGNVKPLFTPVTKLATPPFQPAPPPPNPPGIVTTTVIYDPSVPGKLTPVRIITITTQGNDVMEFWGILLFCVARKFLVAGAGRAWWWIVRVLRFALELIRLANGTTSTTLRIAIRDGTLTPGQVSNAPGSANFKGTAGATNGGSSVPNPPTPPPIPTGNDSPDAANFRGAWVAILTDLQPLVPAIVPTPINVTATAGVLVTGLSPSVTLLQSLLSRLQLPGISWQPVDTFDPVQAAPSFPQPMWSPLRDESVDWILPGLDQVPTNSVGLVVSNQRFIEAYMAGLNHEMARTLLWNGYPTDQRGSYFLQFWDSRANPGTGNADIKPITSWGTTTSLGGNSARSMPPALVLLVRGDLMRRYPNTVVYALQAVTQPTQPPPPAPPVTPVPPPDGAAQTLPIFSGQLTRDISYYGFPISKEQVLATPGFVFALQEMPAEPRFAGLPATTPVNPTTPTFIVPSAVPGTNTAADFAVLTFQNPVRVIVPGNLLVPTS